MALWISLSALAALFVLPFVLPGLRLTVLYDGSCPMCRRAMAWLRRLDWAGQLEAQSMRDWEAVSARFPGLDMAACERDMHAVTSKGRVYRGYRAYQAIAWRLPLLAPLCWLLWLPPVSTLGARIYRRVADRRMVEGCGTESCEIRPRG